MDGVKPLCDLKVGEKCKVLNLDIRGTLQRRLGDLGIIEGAEIECVLISPLGDPHAFLVCGTLIALRKEESKLIDVEVM